EVDSRTLNRKALESLVKSGALDGLGLPRAALYRTLDAVVSSAQKESRDLAAGQASLFDGADHPAETAPAIAAAEEWGSRERLAFEKETLGFYISGHPLSEHQQTLAALQGPTTRSLTPEMSGRTQSLGGLVTALKKRKTRRGDWMATFTLEDLEGGVEVMVFPELYKVSQARLVDESAVVVRGKAELEDGRFRLVAEEISPLAGAAERHASRLILEVSADGFGEERAREVHRLLMDNPGDCMVLIRVVQPGGYRLTVRPQIPLRIGPNPGLTQALERVLGKGSVSYR
ncbi:MAG: OB-fold nucleic acid binding domain-containing protein, partial [Acidobacteria bacterium]|nr:OB-fold nucleic acid binding domain-containing protein [Acidobacteriota bacterium]